MTRTRPFPPCFLLLLLLSAPAMLLARHSWPALAPADLTARTSDWCSDADAEVLLSRIELRFHNHTTTRHHYRRVKVYTQQGIHEVEKLTVDHSGDVEIALLAARLSKSDGTVQEFGEKDFKESLVAKMGDDALRSRRLVIPTLAPGDVLEMAWEETMEGWPWFQTVYAQESLPVRDFSLTTRIEEIPVNITWYHVPDARMQRLDATDLEITAHHLGALLEEEFMPPAFDLRGYVLIAYGEAKLDPKQGWDLLRKRIADFDATRTDITSRVRELARSLCAGAQDDEEKVRRLYDYCQSKVHNVDYNDSIRDMRESRATSESWMATKVLKEGKGNSLEIHLLFISLLKAVGIDARLAWCCSRDHISDAPRINGWYYMSPRLVATRHRGNWAYFCPGNPRLGFGELRWQEEGAHTIISDPKEFIEKRVPSTKAEQNCVEREATFTIDDEGNLDGDLAITLTGQEAVQWRMLTSQETNEQLVREFAEAITTRIPAADIAGVSFENRTAPGTPVAIRAHLHIPGYGSRVADRLMLIPNIFENGSKPCFGSNSRHHAFRYPFSCSQHDTIVIHPPRGMRLVGGAAPEDINLPAIQLRQHISITQDPGSRELRYERTFGFGKAGMLLFSKQAFPVLWQSDIDRRRLSSQTLVLQAEGSSEPGSKDL